jgi:hypothetical protein
MGQCANYRSDEVLSRSFATDWRRFSLITGFVIHMVGCIRLTLLGAGTTILIQGVKKPAQTLQNVGMWLVQRGCAILRDDDRN